jgi:hypothetical protein
LGFACEGTWYTANNCVYWIWHGKSYEFLNFVPGFDVAFQYPSGINNQGQIVWLVYDMDWNVHVYLQDGTRTISLDVPGALSTSSWDINNSGDVPLNASGTDFAQKYLWRKGALVTLPDVPASWGSIGSTIYGVNDLGDYSGTWMDANSTAHGFIAFRRYK